MFVAVLACVTVADADELWPCCRATSGASSRLASPKGCHDAGHGQAVEMAANNKTEVMKFEGRIATAVRCGGHSEGASQCRFDIRRAWCDERLRFGALVRMLRVPSPTPVPAQI